MVDPSRAAQEACLVWNTALATESLERFVECRSVILLPASEEDPRFCFLSVGSPVETLLALGPAVLDEHGADLALGELWGRLLDGEVAAALAPRGAVAPAQSAIVPPTSFVERRNQIRHDNVLARFLLRQIGLEEVSSHRGAPAQLYRAIESRWSHDLSMCTDPAMLLTLGADRQRYVDESFTERATDRLPRALGRLHDLGVRAYPRLVIV